MTEASYTAWDDKQYVWPPPDGWYKASDNKWWPNGYGPPEAEPAAPAADTASTAGADPGSTAATETAVASDAATTHSYGSTNGSAAAGPADDTTVNAADGTDVSGAAAGSAGSDSTFSSASNFGSDAKPGGDDRSSSSSSIAVSDVDGIPTGDIDTPAADRSGEMPVPGLGDFRTPGRSETSAPGLGDFRSPEPETTIFPPPSIDDLPRPGSTGSFSSSSSSLGSSAGSTSSLDDVLPGTNADAGAPARKIGLDDATAEIGADMRAAVEQYSDPDATIVADGQSAVDAVGEAADGDSDIPSIRDLASPEFDLTDISISDPEPGSGLDIPSDAPDPDATQLLTDEVETHIVPPPGAPLDALPPPMGPTDLLPPPGGLPSDLPPPGDLPDPGSFPAPGDFPAPGTLPAPGDLGELPPPGDLPPAGDLPPTGELPPPGSLPAPTMSPDGRGPQIDAFSAERQAEMPGDSGALDNRGWGGEPGQLPPSSDGPPPQYAQAPPPGQPSIGDPSQAHDVGYGQYQSGQVLDGKKGGSNKRMIAVILGVLLLALLCAIAFWFFVINSSDDQSANGPGSFAEPHPRATGVVVFYPDGEVDQRWIVQILEPVRDATQEIVDGGSNPPADGEIFAAARVRVLNESGVEGASLAALQFNAVSSGGDVIIRGDNQCSFSLEDLDYAASVPIGAEVEGDVCWSITPEQLNGLLLGLESQEVAGRVHIQMQ